jgi:hypothetical protein
MLLELGTRCSLHVTTRRDAPDGLTIDVYLVNMSDDDVEAPRWMRYFGDYDTELLISLWVRHDDGDVMLRSPRTPPGRCRASLGVLQVPMISGPWMDEPFVIKAHKRVRIKQYIVPVKARQGYWAWCTLCLPVICNDERGETSILMRSNVDFVAPATDRKETAEGDIEERGGVSPKIFVSMFRQD